MAYNRVCKSTVSKQGIDFTMSRNIEIKARISKMEEMHKKVADLADQGPIEILQDDTFFSCPNGRLKLRILSEDEGQLIFYRRQDKSGPKESFYVISSTSSPESLMELLTLAYGRAGCIRKRRVLYMRGRTRIHLDRVDGLGDFLELEVVMEDGEDPQTAAEEADELLKKLGILTSQLVKGAYIDMTFHS
jgi:predicted adenylyl cyclase CyaB